MTLTAPAFELLSALTYWEIPDDRAGGFNAPQKPLGTNNTTVPLRRAPASQLLSAVLQNGALWTCQHVGFNSSGSYSSTSPATRSGIVWSKLQVNSGSPLTLSHYATPVYGKIYDNSATPYWYYYPSLMANSQGDIVIGFSGSKSTEHIGAFYWGRTANGSQVLSPVLVQGGRDYFQLIDIRWGDYSAAALDPRDQLSFCTFLQIAEWDIFNDEISPGTVWKSWISTIKLGP